MKHTKTPPPLTSPLWLHFKTILAMPPQRAKTPRGEWDFFDSQLCRWIKSKCGVDGSTAQAIFTHYRQHGVLVHLRDRGWTGAGYRLKEVRRSLRYHA